MKNILYTIILCLLSINLLAEERYSCTVDKFSTSMVGEKDPKEKEQEKEFIEGNLTKKFLITVTENQIFMTTLFNKQHYQTIFTIIDRSVINTYAVNNSRNDIGLYEGLVIERNKYGRKKELPASIFQGATQFNNVWFLNCSSSL